MLHEWLAQSEPITLQSFVGLFAGASGFTVLSAVSWAWYTGKIVTRRELDDAKATAARWEQVALRSLSVTERSQGNTARVAEAVEQTLSKSPGANP